MMAGLKFVSTLHGTGTTRREAFDGGAVGERRELRRRGVGGRLGETFRGLIWSPRALRLVLRGMS